MNVQAAYAAWSRVYDSNENFTRDLDGAITAQLVRELRPKRVLELGSGTGKNSVVLAEVSEHVVGLDFSPEMLDLARARNLPSHVRFVHADLLKPWPVNSDSFDFVMTNLVLEHIEELAPVFHQVASVLQPGGRFFVSELHPFRQYKGTQARFEQDGERILVDAYLHHISDYLSGGREAGLRLDRLDEYWHATDVGKLPRLIALQFVLD